MPTASPAINLIVIRSADIDRAVRFYQSLGMQFVKHSHGKGPAHYASENNRMVFEIYPHRDEQDSTKSVRLGISVDDVPLMVRTCREIGAVVVSEPSETEWGLRAVVKDFDGHTVELLSAR